MKPKLTKAGPNLKRKQANPLPVMEQFYTLQGEGTWTGTPAYFIRLAGCDVGCHWCDVKESWHPEEKQYLQTEEIVVRALASGTDRVVITGGEPTVYDLSLLTQQLHDAGLTIHMETAGVHELIGDIDWVCFSPKKFLKPQEEFYQKASELKIVIFNEHDFTWAEEHASKCADHVQLFLQPEWSHRNKFTAKIVEYAKANPHWRVSLQTHKFIEIP